MSYIELPRIGLSTVNCLNGGKGRLGPCVTALGIMACVMGAYPLLNFIPVAALAGIMLVVVFHTFKWFTIPMLEWEQLIYVDFNDFPWTFFHG